MSLLVANHSSYPRIGDRPEGQKLRRAYDQLDKKEITEEALEKILQEVTTEVISEQEEAGCDIVTDGQVRWADPISPPLRGFRGVRIGGLLRFFDTNFYFRQPIVQKKIGQREGLTSAAVEGGLRTARKPKAVLTGPVTLAALSEISGGEYRQVEWLVEDLVGPLADEIVALAKAGIPWIQIDEPIVVKRPDLLPLLAKTCRNLKKGKARLLLATYFGDATPIFEKLLDLPVDGIGLDCCYGSGLLAKVQRGVGGKAVALGVVDGRSTRLEKVEELARSVRKPIESCGASEVFLTTSCGLEYLPRQRAFEKLVLLAKLKGSLA